MNIHANKEVQMCKGKHQTRTIRGHSGVAEELLYPKLIGPCWKWWSTFFYRRFKIWRGEIWGFLLRFMINFEINSCLDFESSFSKSTLALILNFAHIKAAVNGSLAADSIICIFEGLQDWIGPSHSCSDHHHGVGAPDYRFRWCHKHINSFNFRLYLIFNLSNLWVLVWNFPNKEVQMC